VVQDQDEPFEVLCRDFAKTRLKCETACASAFA
jgi:hypothetical protein